MIKLKNAKLILLVLVIILLGLNLKVYADENNIESKTNETNKSQSNETSVVGKKLDVDLSKVKVGDTFKSYTDTEYKVTQVEGSNIKINGKELNIFNLEISTTINNKETWRKFVKFNDLCSNDNVCKLLEDKKDVVLTRTNSLNEKIYDDSNKAKKAYYRTVYYGEQKQFKSTMVIDEEFYDFKSEDENNNFNKEGILTSDVETLTDKNDDLYVSLRFVTEALGAEVVWTPGKEKDTVEINFYDYSNYCPSIKIETEIDKKNLSKNTDIKYSYTDYDGTKKELNSKLAQNGIFYSKDKKYVYILLMYKSVPILYNLDDSALKTGPNICVNEELLNKANCDGEWVTDSEMIKLSGGSGAYCAINLSSQVKTRSE